MATKKKLRGMAPSEATGEVYNQRLDSLMDKLGKKTPPEPAGEGAAVAAPEPAPTPATAEAAPAGQGAAASAPPPAPRPKPKRKKKHGAQFASVEWEKFTTELPSDVRRALRIYCASQEVKTFEKDVVADVLAPFLKKAGFL